MMLAYFFCKKRWTNFPLGLKILLLGAVIGWLDYSSLQTWPYTHPPPPGHKKIFLNFFPLPKLWWSRSSNSSSQWQFPLGCFSFQAWEVKKCKKNANGPKKSKKAINEFLFTVWATLCSTTEQMFESMLQFRQCVVLPKNGGGGLAILTQSAAI
jgi:hypothetical protein